MILYMMQFEYALPRRSELKIPDHIDQDKLSQYYELKQLRKMGTKERRIKWAEVTGNELIIKRLRYLDELQEHGVTVTYDGLTENETEFTMNFSISQNTEKTHTIDIDAYYGGIYHNGEFIKNYTCAEDVLRIIANIISEIENQIIENL